MFDVSGVAHLERSLNIQFEQSLKKVEHLYASIVSHENFRGGRAPVAKCRAGVRQADFWQEHRRKASLW